MTKRGGTTTPHCSSLSRARPPPPTSRRGPSPRIPGPRPGPASNVRHQLAVWGLGDLEAATELVVSELVGNAIRHAKGPLRLRLLRSRSLICEVYDGSLSTPRIRRATYTDEGGRGLYLVAALCRRWGARYLEEGKCLWAEQELEPAGQERY
ncbi:ATP-binding protein [Streptomyces violaceus]